MMRDHDRDHNVTVAIIITQALEKAFDFFDVNADGDIDPDEFTSGLPPARKNKLFSVGNCSVKPALSYTAGLRKLFPRYKAHVLDLVEKRLREEGKLSAAGRFTRHEFVAQVSRARARTDRVSSSPAEV